MTDEDSVKDLVRLMVDYWEIKEPNEPNLVISIVGGDNDLALEDRGMRDIFSTGLIKVSNLY